MSWRYRVVKHVEIVRTGLGEVRRPYFQIHEFYDNHKPRGSITGEAVQPLGSTVKELRQTLEMMREAFDEPVLNYEDFK